MVDSFSIFAEMLISKIFDYYLKEKIFPKQKVDGKFDVYIDGFVKDAIEKNEQFESSTIRLLIAILKVNLGGETGVNYECTMHQVFFMAQREDNTTYIKVDDSANIDVGIFFKTDDGKKLLIPFEVKTGKQSYFKENTAEPKGHNLPNNEGTFPKMNGPVPGILAHTNEIIIKYVGSKPDTTKYSLFGLKEKPEGIQLNNFEDKKEYIVKFLKDYQYLINRDKNSIGFICRDSETLAKDKSKTLAQEKFQIISLKALFSEFAEQYFKDRFVEEEKTFANTLEHFSKYIEVCWDNYRGNYIDVCLDKIDKNKSIDRKKNKKCDFRELIEKFNNHITKFFINRKISDFYEEFLEPDIKKLNAHIPEENLKNAENEWENIIGIQKLFNGIFDLREKRIEAEFNIYVHNFLNTIETDFYNKWVKK